MKNVWAAFRMVVLVGGTTAASAGSVLAAPPDAEQLVSTGPSPEATRDLRGKPHALGRVITAGPGPTALYLLSSGGYGYTESVLGASDTHHRLAGSLTLDGRPLPWLGLAFRVDGRYDRHAIPGQPADSGMVGDPRLFVRVDQGFGALAIGMRGGVWLPGRNVPSLDPKALSPEVLGALSYAPGNGRLILSANLGYRLDRSARTAMDAALLGPGDRVALDLSAFNSVLAGAAASLQLGPAQVFLEGSWSLLVGAGSPKPLASPIHVGGGVRLALGPRVDLEFQADVSPSLRPDVADPMAALVPLPPRFAAGLGLVYRFTAPPPPAAVAPAPLPVAEPPPPPKEPEEAVVATASVRGKVTTADGSTLPDVRVTVASGERSQPVVVENDGRFTVEGAPGDELVIAVEANGFLPLSQPVTLAAGQPAELALELQRRPPSGQLRGFIRSFRGSAVDAEIVVDGSGTELRAKDGRFEVDVTPGTHEVRISAHGYVTQVRRVNVEQDGVTLLNIDLKRAP